MVSHRSPKPLFRVRVLVGVQFALIVQWIEHFTTDEEIGVRVSIRVHLIRSISQVGKAGLCKSSIISSNLILTSVFGTRIGLRDVIVAHGKCGFEFRRTPRIGDIRFPNYIY